MKLIGTNNSLLKVPVEEWEAVKEKLVSKGYQLIHTKHSQQKALWIKDGSICVGSYIKESSTDTKVSEPYYALDPIVIKDLDELKSKIICNKCNGKKRIPITKYVESCEPTYVDCTNCKATGIEPL